ncbi:hypothetical protein V8E36_004747 [Tilletia maclaganii]
MFFVLLLLYATTFATGASIARPTDPSTPPTPPQTDRDAVTVNIYQFPDPCTTRCVLRAAQEAAASQCADTAANEHSAGDFACLCASPAFLRKVSTCMEESCAPAHRKSVHQVKEACRKAEQTPPTIVALPAGSGPVANVGGADSNPPPPTPTANDPKAPGTTKGAPDAPLTVPTHGPARSPSNSSTSSTMAPSTSPPPPELGPQSPAPAPNPIPYTPNANASTWADATEPSVTTNSSSSGGGGGRTARVQGMMVLLRSALMAAVPFVPVLVGPLLPVLVGWGLSEEV